MNKENEHHAGQVSRGKKEWQRWNGFFDTLIHPAPDMGIHRVAVWKKNKATLWHYPPSDKKYKTPLFLIYSLVNQPSILDIGPGNSLIQSFVDEGYDVYLLDFGIPGYEDKDFTLDDYIIKYIQKGVQRAILHSGADEISVMGFCLGGTLAAVYASIAEEPIKNLILSLAPVDFHEFPIFDEWLTALKDEQIDVDTILDACGLVPSSFIEGGIRLITSPVYYSPYLSLLNRAYDEQYTRKWSRMNQWSKGHIPFTGAALKQLINDLVKENKLINGDLIIGGKQVKMLNIKANLLTVASKYDRLVPQEQIKPIMNVVGSQDKTYHLFNGGHTSLPEKGKVPTYLDDWLSPRSNPIR